MTDPVLDHTDCNKKIEQLQNELKELKKTNVELLSDNKRLKKLFDQSTKINLHKDLKINNIVSDTQNSLISHGKSTFSLFESTFLLTELQALRSISINRTGDSTFVLTSMRFLYKDNLNLLKSRTSTKPTETKQPITPSKKDIVTKIFRERLLVLGLCPSDFNTRFAKLNDHIKTALKNLSKKKMICDNDQFVNDSSESIHQ